MNLTLRHIIIQNAQKQAQAAAEKFYRCRNKYAFIKERKLVARWKKIVERLKRTDPQMFRRKPSTALMTMLTLADLLSPRRLRW